MPRGPDLYPVGELRDFASAKVVVARRDSANGQAIAENDEVARHGWYPGTGQNHAAEV